eukprot:SAG25_NODE_4902_length_734_cov_1.110236_1_plen_216_part_10
MSATFALSDADAGAFIRDSYLCGCWLEMMTAVAEQLERGVSVHTLCGVDVPRVPATCELFRRVAAPGSEVTAVSARVLKVLRSNVEQPDLTASSPEPELEPESDLSSHEPTWSDGEEDNLGFDDDLNENELSGDKVARARLVTQDEVDPAVPVITLSRQQSKEVLTHMQLETQNVQSTATALDAYEPTVYPPSPTASMSDHAMSVRPDAEAESVAE